MTKINTGDIQAIHDDAMRWRALMGTPYMTVARHTGFKTDPTFPEREDHRQLTISLWSKHNVEGNLVFVPGTCEAKELLTLFADVCVKLQGLK